MNKMELVAAVAKNADLSKKDADAAVKAVSMQFPRLLQRATEYS